MSSYVLIGRLNIGEEKSYLILIYQSKNNMGQNEFLTKYTIQKVIVFKRRYPMVMTLKLSYYLIFICFTNVSFVEHTQQEIIHSIRRDTLYNLNKKLIIKLLLVSLK